MKLSSWVSALSLAVVHGSVYQNDDGGPVKVHLRADQQDAKKINQINKRDDSSSSSSDTNSNVASHKSSKTMVVLSGFESASAASNEDDNSNSSSSSKSVASSGSNSKSHSKTDNAHSKDSGSDTNSKTANVTSLSSAKVTSAINRSTISINPQLPAGNLVLVTPTSTASTYVKVGDYATFSWTYTNVLVSPTAVNLELVCTSNMQTYTLAINQTVDDQMFVWNTTQTDEDDQKVISAQYTLVIYDSQLGPSQVAGAGYLTPMQYIFGVYRPQKYTAWVNNNSYINFAAILEGPGLLSAAALGLFSAFCVLAW